MNAIDMQALLAAGMHFGHLTRRWNPKMKPFIYGVRNGIHIIDLSKTAQQLKGALDFITQAVGDGADVLFVGTKKQAQDIICDEATRCKMFYVNHRWLGGTLTNWKTIKASIDRLTGLQKKKADGTFAKLNKKELLMIDREIEKLLHALGGIQNMTKPPGVMVVIDPKMEHLALHEANLLGIPVLALADTNCDPDAIDYLVAGNDDALRSIQLFLSHIADKILEGLQIREIKVRQAADERRSKEESKPSVREVDVGGNKAGAYVAERGTTEVVDEAASGQYSAKVEVAAKPEASEDEKKVELAGEVKTELASEVKSEPASEAEVKTAAPAPEPAAKESTE